ncbi:MAG: helix-turn-helix domain-containing protein [Peptostreptococcaceae bacterium]
MENLGMKIKIARENAKISRKELSNYLNISPSALANYENGYRTPSNEILINICTILKINLSDLISEFDEGVFYKEIFKEASKRNDCTTDIIREYVSLLDSPDLVYNIAYAQIFATEKAKKSILDYLISDIKSTDIEIKDLSYTEQEDLYKFTLLSIESKLKEILNQREHKKVEETHFENNIKYLFDNPSKLEGSSQSIINAKKATKTVLSSLVCSLIADEDSKKFNPNNNGGKIFNKIKNIMDYIDSKPYKK